MHEFRLLLWLFHDQVVSNIIKAAAYSIATDTWSKNAIAIFRFRFPFARGEEILTTLCNLELNFVLYLACFLQRHKRVNSLRTEFMIVGIESMFMSKMFCNCERLFRTCDPYMPGYNSSSNNFIS